MTPQLLEYSQRWYLVTIRSTWTIFLLVPLTSIVTALSCSMEASNWKFVLVQPYPRVYLYLAKLLSLNLFMLLTGCLLALLTWISKILLGLPLPLSGLIELTGHVTLLAVVALWPVIAVQLWLSTRFRQFFIPVGIGLFGNFAGLLAAFSSEARYMPWAGPITLLAANGQRSLDIPYMLIMVCAGLFFVIAGCIDFAHREVQI